MIQTSVNLLAVLVAGIASFILGGIWYAKPVFGKQWMKFSGVKMGGKNPTKAMAIGFLATLVMSYILAHFIKYTQSTTVLDGMIGGFWIWLGFVATTTLYSVIYEGKSLKLYVLNNGYNLLSLLLMGAILAVWP